MWPFCKPITRRICKKLRISLLFVLEAPDTLCEGEWGRILYTRKKSPDVIRGHPSRRSSVSGFRRDRVCVNVGLVFPLYRYAVTLVEDEMVFAERSFARARCQGVEPWPRWLSSHCRYSQQVVGRFGRRPRHPRSTARQLPLERTEVYRFPTA